MPARRSAVGSNAGGEVQIVQTEFDGIHHVAHAQQLLHGRDRRIGPGLIDLEEARFEGARHAETLGFRFRPEGSQSSLGADEGSDAVNRKTGILRQFRAENDARVSRRHRPSGDQESPISGVSACHWWRFHCGRQCL